MSIAARTLVLLYPGCIAFEVQLAAELLNRKYPLCVATPDGRDHVASNGMHIRSDCAYGDAERDSKVILVPGGDPASIMNDEAVGRALVAGAAAGSVIGAICAGPVVLGKAGLLRGRRFTHGYGDHHREFLAPFWSGATYENRSVVEDGPLITAQAWAHVEFAVTLAARCDALPENRTAATVRAYYEGRRPREDDC